MTDTAPAKPRRWVLPLLFLSLALNLLIAGIVVGWVASKGPPSRDDARAFGPARSVMGEPFVRALPDADRQALARAIEGEMPRLRENRAALRTRFEALLVALKAEPFDPEAVRDLLGEQRDVAVRRQQIGEMLLIDRLSAMSADERAAYADRLAKGLRHLRRD